MAVTPRQSPVQTAKREQNEARLLESTERLLSGGESFASLSIDKIATGAGLSRTAFYFYFTDKRTLLVKLTEQLAAQLHEQADHWFNSVSLAPESLRGALGKLVSIYREHFVLLRAVDQAGATDEMVVEFWRAVVQGFIDPVRDRIEAASGDVNPAVDADHVAFALAWGAERATFMHVRDREPELDEAFVDQLTGVWLRAVFGRLPDAG